MDYLIGLSMPGSRIARIRTGANDDPFAGTPNGGSEVVLFLMKLARRSKLLYFQVRRKPASLVGKTVEEQYDDNLLA